MEQEIKVSVIVPVYNSQAFLRRCMDSILGQSLEEIEIICVDDALRMNQEIYWRNTGKRIPGWKCIIRKISMRERPETWGCSMQKGNM